MFHHSCSLLVGFCLRSLSGAAVSSPMDQATPTPPSVPPKYTIQTKPATEKGRFNSFSVFYLSVCFNLENEAPKSEEIQCFAQGRSAYTGDRAHPSSSHSISTLAWLSKNRFRTSIFRLRFDTLHLYTENIFEKLLRLHV